jgi:3'-phosphoadenosine 5'-phosphosulfate sulfotransferase (PAPS reductase)/FAD synthetase
LSKASEAFALLDAAIREHNPSHVFAGYSGGHDSLVSTHIAAQHPRFSGVFHANTTIGIEETRLHMRATCERFDWPLKEYYPPESYRDMCLKYGFPGPGAHMFCFIKLKERSIKSLVRDHKTGRKDRIMLVTGARASESKRRMGHVEIVQRDGALVWVAPCIDFTDDEKEAYIAEHNLPRNPVVDAIGMSGECLCGAFANNGKRTQHEELAIIGEHFPKTANLIAEITQACKDAGVHAQWGARPPKDTKTMPLCFHCEGTP